MSTEIAKFFRIMSNENRRNILVELNKSGDAGKRFWDIRWALNLNSNTLTYHMKKLIDSGMVSKKHGRYYITKFGKRCLSYYRDFEKMVAKWTKEYANTHGRLP